MYDWSRTLALAYLVAKLIKFARRVGARGLIKALGASVLGSVGAVLPGVVNGLVKGAVKKELEGIEKELLGDGDPDANMALPPRGISSADILSKATDLKGQQAGFAEGIKWGGIYHDGNKDGGDPLGELQHELWGMFNNTNLLYPGVFLAFASLRPKQCKWYYLWCTVTMPVLLGSCPAAAPRAYCWRFSRIAHRATRVASRNPRSYAQLRLTLHSTKRALTLESRLLKLQSMRRQATSYLPRQQRRTSRVIRSRYMRRRPFTHGVMDPVKDLAKVAIKHNIGLHVDNCLGGFLASYLIKVGAMDASKAFDFSVEGVTTMSIDVHKYGFASKGVSVVCFRDPSFVD